MGSWGVKLYQDDLAEDVRSYYKEQVRKGKNCALVTQELLEQYKVEVMDSDAKSVFWFALAETQWSLGLLEERVKEAALRCIDDGGDIERWRAENPKMVKARERVIEDLKAKLLSPQPSKKKLAQYKIYHCEWKVGDVFAYRMESDLAKEVGFYGRYLLIQKVDEGLWYPGHTVPIVYVKITKDNTLPTNIEQYNQLEFVQTAFTRYEDRFFPIDMKRPNEDIEEKSKINYQVDDFGFLLQYRARLLNTSKRAIPSKLIYVGNLAKTASPQKEFIPHSKDNIVPLSWKGDAFEREMIQLYFGHNLKKFDIYRGKD